MTWNLKENARLLTIVSSVLTGAASAAVTYVVANKLVEKKFRLLADKEIAEAKVYYQGLYSRAPFVAVEEPASDEELLVKIKQADTEIDGVPIDLVGNALAAMERYAPEDDATEEVRIMPQEVASVVNVFRNTPPGDQVLDALLAERDEEKPYIITKTEFFDNEPDNEQKAFTYFEGDQVLVDDQDEYSPITNTDLAAGDDNLLHFGYGSYDENVLYVRNPTMNPPLDLVITRHTGRYTDEIMGLVEDEPHLKHSQPRRFKLNDE